MRTRVLKAAAVTATLGALLLWGCDPPGYSRQVRYNEVELTVISLKQAYAQGEAVPITLIVRNTGDKSFTFDTAASKGPQDPVTRVGLEAPRPAFDLLFVGYTVDQGGKQSEQLWLWSQQAAAQAATSIVLKPGETKELLSATWQPPAASYVQGQFTARFADMEFPTGVRIEHPKR